MEIKGLFEVTRSQMVKNCNNNEWTFTACQYALYGTVHKNAGKAKLMIKQFALDDKS